MSGFKILVFIIGLSVSAQAQYSPDWKSLVTQITKVYSQKRHKNLIKIECFRIVDLYPNGMMKQKLEYSCTLDLLVYRVSKVKFNQKKMKSNPTQMESTLVAVVKSA